MKLSSGTNKTASKIKKENGVNRTQKECRICQESDNDNDFIEPCNCTGSIRFVHRKCLTDWLNYTYKTGKANNGVTTCTICGQIFLVKWERPHLGHYIFERSKAFTFEFILSKITESIFHLVNPCNHILLCWLLKILGAILIIYASLFLGRIELWIFSNGNLEGFHNSFDGAMDNILVTIVSFSFHLAVLFMLTIFVKIVQKSNNINATRKLWAHLRGTAGVSLAALAGVILPGYKARLTLWILFGVEWNRFQVNFGTGQNFAWHFSLGVLSILIDVLCITASKWIYQDYKKYREQNSKQIPYY